MPNYMTFEDARSHVQEWVRSHKTQIRKLFPRQAWKQIYHKMNNPRIPSDPADTYDNFLGYKDWIGSVIYPPIGHSAKPKAVKTDTFPEPTYIKEETQFDTKFNKNIRSLWEFGCKNGTYIVPNEKKYLQQWTNSQRASYKKGLMNQERLRAFRSMHFDLEPQQEGFNGYYNLLIAFKELHGHVDVPIRYLPNRKLGDWVKSQRIYYRRGHLSKHKIDKLNDIGFRWEIPNDERFLPIEKRGNNEKTK